MLYTYNPASPRETFPALDIHGPGQYELDEGQAAQVNAIVKGKNGPALRPVQVPAAPDDPPSPDGDSTPAPKKGKS